MGGLEAHTQGEVDGSGRGGLQAHTQGEAEGSDWGAGVSRPTRGGGVSQHALRQTPLADGYCCGQSASYWNAFLLRLYPRAFLVESEALNIGGLYLVIQKVYLTHDPSV